ncbi:TIM44-like domain-containing protein [Methylobacterium sp. R2-1]|uniref:Tim44 domain-containing protein n=1 Tax=Methylobacterium sp. R2-1 TaxID=2587064 RepID=UPI00160FFF03|nr:TIM44-like domain-containing protein [Methylobacterium sp. R2-1]MBB2963662.1 putative lipid-binding transport protein (Tim44 family) [Methylobacterium sp. R2-1]
MASSPARRRRVVTLLALAASLALAAPAVDARPGGGGGMGSRGSKTFSAPPSTATSPGAMGPIQRSQTSPSPGFNNPGMAAQSQGRRFGGGFLGGMLGAGLIGALLGAGLSGGLGGIGSFIGLIFQIGLIALLVMFVVRFFRRRQEGNQPAMAGNAPHARSGLPPQGGMPGGVNAGMNGGMNAGMNPMGGSYSGGARPQPVQVQPEDFQAFERSLNEIQGAYGREDVAALRRLATPEMVGYFEEDLRANAARGVVNRISDVKLLQGDLSEAWREGPVEFATVAMRFSLRDEVFERSTNRHVENGPQEAKEFWTFVREPGGPWRLSAIQQGR